MRSTGMVRMVDYLGRIVLPKEQRTHLGIETGTPMEIFLDHELIILRKYAPGCVFCRRVEDCVIYMDKKVCSTCAQTIGGV